MSNGNQEIKVNFPQQLQGGVYSNNLVVSHSKEEFIMDFIMISPPSGSVTARVIISPGHMKRIISALGENVNKYEDKFGKIEKAEEPGGKVGFHP
jgi:hypothetical protein